MTRSILLRSLTALTAAGALAFAGCGETAPSTSFNAASDPVYTEQQVADLAGFQSTDDGMAWIGSGCQISVIMTTRASVEMYADAGDAVVTNPAGTVGVKFFPDPGCRVALLHALQDVK
jgi:hypothetical protein